MDLVVLTYSFRDSWYIKRQTLSCREDTFSEFACYFQGSGKCFLEKTISPEVLFVMTLIGFSKRYQKEDLFTCFLRLDKKVTKCVSVEGIYLKGCVIKHLKLNDRTFLQDPRIIVTKQYDNNYYMIKCRF